MMQVSMTREEAILLSAYTGFLLAPDFSEVHKFCEDTLGRPIWTHEFADSCVQKEIQEKLRPQIMELVQNIAALRPVSREQVEKVWRGCSWCNNEGKKPENWECSLLDDRGFSVVVGDEVVWTNAEFCPVCGKPLTDEAVDMVMERLEALHNG